MRSSALPPHLVISRSNCASPAEPYLRWGARNPCLRAVVELQSSTPGEEINMRFLSIATASVLALTAGAAFAQMSPPSSTSTTPPAATMPGANGIGGAAVAPRQPVRNPLTEQDVSQLKGTNVYGSDDKKIGDISTALMDPGSKRIDRLVVAAIDIGALEL